MSDDPFAEPSDAEKTIIRPRPSGTAAAPAQGMGMGAAPRHDPFAHVAPAAPMGGRDVRPMPQTGSNPLVAAASPVLAAIVRISGDAARGPDVDRLKRAMVDAIRKFETDALATGMDTRSLRAARYALCA